MYTDYFSPHNALHVNLRSIFDHPLQPEYLGHVSASFSEHFCGIAKDVMVGSQRHAGVLVSLTVLDLVVCL